MHERSASLLDVLLAPREDLGGATLGAALLAVHRPYLAEVRALRDVADVHSIAHVTGGGWEGNIPRALPSGTAARIEGLDISGKTGTVQVVAQHGWVKGASLPYRSRDHAWFASFAPRDNAQMVVVVFIEHGGHGGTESAPLAKLMYESRFKDQVNAARLDLTNPDTLQQIKDGQLPLPANKTR
jgi:hypothetical protein